MFSKSITYPFKTVSRTFSTSTFTRINVLDSIDDISRKMKDAKVHRAYIVYDASDSSFKFSHPMFTDVADYITNLPAFDRHMGVFFTLGSSGFHSAFIHNTNRGPASGGIKRAEYESLAKLIQDGLQLSQTASKKAASANIWLGGGKTIIPYSEAEIKNIYTNTQYSSTMSPSHVNSVIPDSSADIFHEHADFVESLQGLVVGSKDYGVSDQDMKHFISRTTYATWNRGRGGGGVGADGDVNNITGEGVVVAMEALVKWDQQQSNLNNDSVEPNDTLTINKVDFSSSSSYTKSGCSVLEGKSVAIVGAGSVACGVINALIQRNISRLVIADTNKAKLDACAAKYSCYFPNIEFKHVSKWDISTLALDVDILSPCAYSGSLNPFSIPSIKARYVVPGSNHTLLDPKRDASSLKQRGILYLPDFIVNRMATVTSYINKHAGTIINDPLVFQHFDEHYEYSIPSIVNTLMNDSVKNNCTPSISADIFVNQQLEMVHPVWGNRGDVIMKDLVLHGWEHQGHSCVEQTSGAGNGNTEKLNKNKNIDSVEFDSHKSISMNN